MAFPPSLRGPRGHIALVAALSVAALIAPTGAAWASSGLTAAEATLPANSAPIPQADLNSVSCISPVQCVAVGRYQSNDGGHALIITKDTTWGLARSALLPADALGTANAVLNGVSCVSWGNCVAVGQYETAAGFEGLIETERGGIWKYPVRSPLPSDNVGSSVTSLNSVSCVAINHCVAVGQYTNAAGNQAFIAWQAAGVWDRATRSPLPRRAKSNFITQLDGVSCTSWGYCVAVGQYVNSAPARRGMIVTEAAGVWNKAVGAQLPTNSHANPWAGLFSVRCVSLGNCVAVGVYEGPSHGQGLIIGESHGVWGRGLVAPLPAGFAPGAYASQLLSVSCVSVGNCTAVGQFTAGQIDRGVLISEIKGGWGNPTLTPQPSNAVSPYFEALNGVSCVTTHCSMVGQYQAQLGQPAEIISTG